MASQNRSALGKRCHIVLIPGFGGFDALGQVEYYAGITPLFHKWKRNRPVVLHYFDNLPSAAVVTRAARLRRYLAKRIARGEILDTDKIVLVGHSTGGLDVRQLVWDLCKPDEDPLPIDGRLGLPNQTIRQCLDGVVFLSVPHWGTNIADWVYSHPVLRTAVVTESQAVVAGSQLYPLDSIEQQFAGGAAQLTGAELLLAVRDALTEANPDYGEPGPLRTAEAQEAASELALYFRHMASDFRVINDLTAKPHDLYKKSPAHFDDDERAKELKLWNHLRIRTLSYASVGGRPFRFRSGCRAPVWELTSPFTYPEIARDLKLSAKTDFLYRLCYRACAGGPFCWPPKAGEPTRVLGPAPPHPIEVWDNDGIVNTASMFWPKDEIVLVVADHLDVVGHYKLVKVEPAKSENSGYGPARTYQSYDSFKSFNSVPPFSDETFEDLWTEIFDFSIHSKAFDQRRPSQPHKVKLAPAAAGC